MSVGLYSWIYNTLNGCLPFRTLVDTENGLRRMDRSEIAEYQVMVAFGRCTQGEAPGFPHGPPILESVLFSVWVRPETPDPGDLLLEDIAMRILRTITHSERPLVQVGQSDCVMDARLEAPVQEPVFDDDMQAWMKSMRILFLVNPAMCRESLEWCNPCMDVAPDDDGNGDGGGGGEAPAELETAFFEVFPLQEALADEFDMYVCHPVINTTFLDANPNVPADSLKLFYGSTSIVQRSASAYFQGLRDVTVESDYWHTDGIMDEDHRITHPTSTNTWLVRPSASLGVRLANAMIDLTSDYFDGIYADESPNDIPNHYWNTFKTAGGADAVDDDDRPFWEARWDEMHEAFVTTFKNHFGSTKAFVANAALGTNPKWDGKTTESSHIVLAGEAAARASFEQQGAYWEESATKFGDHPLNVAWDYPALQTAGLIMAGTTG